MLVHWPGAAKQDARSPRNAELRRETWRVLEEYHAARKFLHIGVSNYCVPHLRELLGYCQARRLGGRRGSGRRVLPCPRLD